MLVETQPVETASVRSRTGISSSRSTRRPVVKEQVVDEMWELRNSSKGAPAFVW